MIKCLRNNLKILLGIFYKIFTGIFTLISFVLMFFPINIEENNNWYILIAIICIIIVLLFVSTIYLFIKLKVTKYTIYKSDRTKINILISDIVKLSFRKHKEKAIYVINVNDTFETTVDEPSVPNPLVSRRTIHGQWLEMYYNKQKKFQNDSSKVKSTLDKIIEDKLKGEKCNIVSKDRGKQKSYEPGTSVIVEDFDNFYMLVALSTFDENNNAQSTKESIRKTIEKMLDTIDSKGQGYNVYLPVMGTGKSRSGMSYMDAFNLLKSSIIAKSEINCEFNIVIYHGDADKIKL